MIDALGPPVYLQKKNDNLSFHPLRRKIPKKGERGSMAKHMDNSVELCVWR